MQSSHSVKKCARAELGAVDDEVTTQLLEWQGGGSTNLIEFVKIPLLQRNTCVDFVAMHSETCARKTTARVPWDNTNNTTGEARKPHCVRYEALTRHQVRTRFECVEQ